MLTARKTAHIRSLQRRSFVGRTQTVVLTLRTPGGGTETLEVQAIWRIQIDADPSLLTPGAAGVPVLGPDVFAVFDQADITYAQIRACISAVLGTDAAGTTQVAQRYRLVDVEPFGMTPGGDRFFTRWSREQ